MGDLPEALALLCGLYCIPFPSYPGGQAWEEVCHAWEGAGTPCASPNLVCLLLLPTLCVLWKVCEMEVVVSGGGGGGGWET